MNYLQDYSLQHLKPISGKPVNIAPKNWDTLMPMKNPAYRNDIMLRKGWSVLDEYNKLGKEEDTSVEGLKNPNLNFSQINGFKRNLWELPNLKRQLYEWQTQKTSK